MVLRPLRTIASLTLLGGALWAAFAIDLGERSFAEHIDTISETPEAQELIKGTRATLNPALQEVRDRVLGEYVEAPTWIPEGEELARPSEGPTSLLGEREARVPASTLDTGEGFEPPLPGRARQPHASLVEPEMEPPLPGRR